MSEKMLSAGKGALFLTALSAISQVLGFFYRVILSRLTGAEVMGLYQLIMPVYSVILSLTAVGVTSAASNLASQHLALGNRRAADQTISACLKAFFLLLLPVGAVVILGSDAISVYLLGDARTQLGLILLIPCVALMGVENCHKHYFYGSGVVRPPAIVELLEQFVRTFAVIALLVAFLPQYPERVVGLIVAGMVICEIFSSCTLVVLYRRRRGPLTGRGEEGKGRRRRIFAIALPVGLNALLGNLLGAANSALIPQKLVEGGLDRSASVSQFGVVCGMTMPMLSLPIVFLGALNLVMVPRLARACALNRPAEARRLIAQAALHGLYGGGGARFGPGHVPPGGGGGVSHALGLRHGHELRHLGAGLRPQRGGAAADGGRHLPHRRGGAAGLYLGPGAPVRGGHGGLCGRGGGRHRPGAGAVPVADRPGHRAGGAALPVDGRPRPGRRPGGADGESAVSGAEGLRPGPRSCRAGHLGFFPDFVLSCPSGSGGQS